MLLKGSDGHPHVHVVDHGIDELVRIENAMGDDGLEPMILKVMKKGLHPVE